MGTLGFRAEDDEEDDAEQAPVVFDGQSSDSGYSPEAFVSMCERLRDLGAVEVRMGDMRARFERIELKMNPTALQHAPAPKKKPKQPVAPILSPEARAEAEREKRLLELTGGL